MTTYKKGDEVEITLTGRVRSTYNVHGGNAVVVVTSAGSYAIVDLGDEETSVKLVEPEYENNGVYCDAHGTVWQYYNPALLRDEHARGAWKKLGKSGVYSYETPMRPLRKMEIK